MTAVRAPTRDTAWATAGNWRVMFFRLREASETVVPALRAWARQPSPFSSDDHSRPTGNLAADVAIIGERAFTIAGLQKAFRLPFLQFCHPAILRFYCQR